MPPRRRAAAAAAAAIKGEDAQAPAAAPAPTRPSKRARRSAPDEDEQGQGDAPADAQPDARTEPEPETDAAPPPPEEEAPPPPDDAPPPPPPDEPAPPPPADEAPPPPPPAEPEAEADDEEDEDIGGAEYWAKLAAQEEAAQQGRNDLYLDTINRSLLDFDFEKLCSISLSNTNVYACLVCGKYFQGRGPSSHAYFHSIDESAHRVYMNLQSGDVYILPDNYLVRDPSLGDIRYLLHPTYSEKQLAHIDAPDVRPSFDLQGHPYLPGFVGLNNISSNDYMNVVIQVLAHVKPLRDFFLRGGSRQAAGGGAPLAAKATTTQALTGHPSLGELAGSSELVRRFTALVRKLWNPRAFKAQVSPHEFLQEVNNVSKGKFKITQQADPVEFLGWLLNHLHMDLGGGKKRGSIISACFQGEVRIESQKVFVRSGIEIEDEAIDSMDADGRREGGQQDAHGNAKFNIDREIKTDRSPFFLLAIDLPPMPVFQDVIEKNIIPQVSLAEVLAKYDGVSYQEARGMIRRYKCTKLPPFVILHFRRFTKTEFLEQRNQTIINFPITGLDLANYIDDPSLAPLASVYDLVGNITHEATAGTVRDNSIWRSQVHTRVDGKPIGTDEQREARKAEKRDAEEEKWFQIQDLIIEEINRSMIFLGETYVQVWERRGSVADVERTMRRIAAQKAASAAGAAAGGSAAAASKSASASASGTGTSNGGAPRSNGAAVGGKKGP